MAEIVLESLAHSYSASPQHRHDYAIRKMTHTWRNGGAYALLGPSGCGKSTMLNIISGLLIPSEGKVIFDKQDVSQMAPQERNIAQVFQFPVVYDTMTVYDNLAFPLRNMKTPEAKVRSRVSEVAELLELNTVLDKRASNLTADEKQKVSMGRGLVREDVSAILFDEPLTVIDPHLKWKLRRKLRQIHEQFHITMIYVTHDQLEAATFAEEIAVMYDGAIVQFGSPRELFERPNHTFVGFFIGSPGMNLLPVSRTSDGNVQFEDTAITLTQSQRDALAATESQNVKVGIRPEFIHVWQEKRPDSWEVPVQYVEDLGTYKIVTVQFGSEPIKLRIAEEAPVPKEFAHISFPAQWLKLYIDEYLIGEPQDADATGGQDAD
ncbi:ABC transporter ATP-binding protein [Enterovibrio paralichthyis]|uniref:ABC transporter ATP-binding protein n=1 Tax=Enterovibrio paralichthyis TaxID=2853805 RepID=UPI001C476F5A|nr:ABC transporter ATP-binding protein [Enterovibrio paralichthyis]MBV7297262.1 ABC transporter ATP-binding protein [Enterovibrio paralichthyis]